MIYQRKRELSGMDSCFCHLERKFVPDLNAKVATMETAPRPSRARFEA
jgi:hypothetical protein